MEAGAGPPVKRQCRITLKELAEAFDMASDDATSFLDLETGEVFFVTGDTARELERIYESLPSSLANASDDEQRAALITALENEGLPGWLYDQILETDAIDRARDTRYVALPEADSHADYGDMEAFVETVPDSRFQSRLDRAIRGRGAFRRFRDELLDEPAERERWFAFKHERLRERAREWLADEGIELIEG
jgi:hypothetical protein